MSDDIYDVRSSADGPEGALPLTEELLATLPSGDIFGWTQDVGMGWKPSALGGPEVLILSTQGGVRAEDGTPIALGYHTGHWEVGLLVKAAAQRLQDVGGVPFAAAVSDPCDGRSQGTTAMFDSLAYRNDAAIVMRRLIRSLPTRSAVVGVATCDKGLPATMIALAGCGDLPGLIVPGGVTLPPTRGEDAGAVQTINTRFVRGLLTLKEAAELGCLACASPGGGCQFYGTAATSQAIAEALGLTLTHAALAPSGQRIWLDCATRSADAALRLVQRGIRLRDILVDEAFENAMLVHAATGGSTNLLLHIPAIAHAVGVRRPTVDDWTRVNQAIPRLVDVLPNGPANHPTVRFFLAGGVPEVMLRLRDQGLLHLGVMTATGRTLGENLDDWERSERRARLRAVLRDRDGVDPDDVIRSLDRALPPTLIFPTGNIAPEGSVIKATAIDPSLIDGDGVFRHCGPVRMFTSERDAIAAVKGADVAPIEAGDVMVLASRGPLGSGMEETAQITIALKNLPFGKHVALITDARFSGVSTGACIGHVGPEALAGGPIGKLRDGDTVEIVLDTRSLTGTISAVDIDLVARDPHPGLRADVDLPDDTRLWAALQAASGGTWGGCVYDVESILARLDPSPNGR